MNAATHRSAGSPDMAQSRLRWQCRRGMRELDVLLSRYLDNTYPHAADAQKRAFCELLTLSDPELAGYMLGRDDPADPELAALVRYIRGDTP